MDRLAAMKKWDRFDLDGDLCFFKYHHGEYGFFEYSLAWEIGILRTIDYEKAAEKVSDGSLVTYGEGKP